MKQVSGREPDQESSRALPEVEAGEETATASCVGTVPTSQVHQPPEMTPERQAAIERVMAMMRKGLPLGVTRPFTRDEMHER